jgi:hypothetical protein
MRRTLPAQLVEKLHHRVLERSVRAESGCLLYGGGRHRTGYGLVHFRLDGPGVTWAAHRVVYLAVHGSIPEGQIVRHSCDVRHCVEITHLIAGTSSENTQDMLDRDRQAAHMRPNAACRRCGASDWVRQKDGHRYCRPCQTRRTVEYNREHGQRARRR